MNGGRVVAEGPLPALFKDEKTLFKNGLELI
jgi:hypothetical protein